MWVVFLVRTPRNEGVDGLGSTLAIFGIVSCDMLKIGLSYPPHLFWALICLETSGIACLLCWLSTREDRAWNPVVRVHEHSYWTISIVHTLSWESGYI
jgi:hypothetical protein